MIAAYSSIFCESILVLSCLSVAITQILHQSQEAFPGAGFPAYPTRNISILWDGRPAGPENSARSEMEELAEVCGRVYLRLPPALALAALAAFLAAFSAAIASNRACSFSSAILSK